MKYLLDTNACIAVLRDKPKAVAEHIPGVVARGDSMLLSSIVLHELWYGVSKSSRSVEQARHLSNFLAAPWRFWFSMSMTQRLPERFGRRWNRKASELAPTTYSSLPNVFATDAHS